MFSAIGNDANDDRPHCLPHLPAGACDPSLAFADGGVHETGELVLPRPPAACGSTRRPRRTSCASRSSSSAASRHLRRWPTSRAEPGEARRRKTAGNGSSWARLPPRLLAALAARGRSRRHARDASLSRRVRERARAGGGAGRRGATRIGRRPPRGARGRFRHGGPADRHLQLELAALRRSLSDLRADASGLPSPTEMASLFDGLRAEAVRERRTLLEVSTGVGIAFFNSARHVGRQHLLDPYGEGLKPLRDEGFGAYAARVARP